MLLQGTELPKQLYLAKESLPDVRTLPAAPAQHGHEAMVFEEPANQEGEAFIRKRTSNRCPLPTPPPGAYSAFPIYPPASHFAFPSGSYPPFPSYPPCLTVPQSTHFMPPSQFQTPPQFQPPPQFLPYPQFQPPDNLPLQTCPSTHPRQRTWRRQKAAQEDEERVARGEPPQKRLAKDMYHYICKQCGLAKNKTTGHTQIKGRWYCPASGLSVAQWRENVQGGL